MQIRNLDRTQLRHENGLDAQRLLPWPALNAPFEGSWCVIRPGTESTQHAHHEHEIFIAMNGAATVVTETERKPFAAGDIVYFEPHVAHKVVNDGEHDFEMYSVWWDPEMSERFTARHRGEA